MLLFLSLNGVNINIMKYTLTCFRVVDEDRIQEKA